MTTSASDIHKKSQTIAVIDDEQHWLKVFRRIFRNSPYAIDTYSAPEQFVETILENPKRYCGIICDIKMPHMDGHQVFKKIKNNPETRNIPFLIVSGVLTQNNNLAKVQGMTYVSKLDDNLREKVFEELIGVIENWPKVKTYLESLHVAEEQIEFFCQFFINYHAYFHEILNYVNRMEEACVSSDDKAISRINEQCHAYMANLHQSCIHIIELIQDSPIATDFVAKMCERGRTSLNMIQTFQIILAEEVSSNQEFGAFLQDCRVDLEKIIVGAEKGYNLRSTV